MYSGRGQPVAERNPGLTSVDGFEQSPLFIVGIVVTYRRDVHDARIVRIDEDACDVVIVTEAHVLPSLTAVSRFEETGACIGTASHQHLAGSDPDNIGVGLGDGHRADGKCRFVFKDRLPRDTVIVRFPEIARADSDIDGRGVTGRTGNALDPSALKSRDPPAAISSL